MKIVLVGVVAIIVGGAGLLVLNRNNDSNIVENQNIQTNQPQAIEQQEAEQSVEQVDVAGAYVSFSEEAMITYADTKRVVFFHADWCSTCNFYKRQIQTNVIPVGITILEADYDNDTELRNRYGVQVQSTFVLLDENGEVLKVWPFAAGLDGAESLYEQVLAV